MKLKNIVDGIGSLIGSFIPFRRNSSLKKKRIKIMSDEEALEYDAKKSQEDAKKTLSPGLSGWWS